MYVAESSRLLYCGNLNEFPNSNSGYWILVVIKSLTDFKDPGAKRAFETSSSVVSVTSAVRIRDWAENVFGARGA